MRGLNGKVAIVTGGGGGIGAAVGRRLIEEGARVALADVDADRARRAADLLGADALAIQFDAADPRSVEAMVEQAASHFGRLDILHNNAALTDPARQSRDRTALDIPLDVWDDTIDVNVKGYLLGCRYAIPHMIAGGGGSIINTASEAALAGNIGRIAYGTSKGAIVTMTKYIATQHGYQNIRCNSISPGAVLTEAFERNAPELAHIIRRHLLTPDFTRVEDVAALVAFLASDDALSITGENIVISGGTLTHQSFTADFADYAAAAREQENHAGA